METNDATRGQASRPRCDECGRELGRGPLECETCTDAVRIADLDALRIDAPSGRSKERTTTTVRDAYRRAAVSLFGISEHEAAVYIRAPEDDPGEWAPQAEAIIYLEADGRTAGDTCSLPDFLDYYNGRGLDNCARLDDAAACGTHIEYINAAVAAVWQ